MHVSCYHDLSSHSLTNVKANIKTTKMFSKPSYLVGKRVLKLISNKTMKFNRSMEAYKLTPILQLLIVLTMLLSCVVKIGGKI